jgi:hypothetical protein
MKILLLIMSLLEISDGLFTHISVGKGIVQESNSLMESLISSGDFLTLKILGAVFCAAILWFVHKRFPHLALTVTSGIVVFYSAVMIWNTGVFLGV